VEYIAFDSHRHYTQARVESEDGQRVREVRVEHDRGALRAFLIRGMANLKQRRTGSYTIKGYSR